MIKLITMIMILMFINISVIIHYNGDGECVKSCTFLFTFYAFFHHLI